MKLMKESQTNLKIVEDGVTKGVQEVKRKTEEIGKQTAPEKEGEQEKEKTNTLNPNPYLKMKEKRKWDRLSASKKNKYYRKANRYNGKTVLQKKSSVLNVNGEKKNSANNSSMLHSSGVGNGVQAGKIGKKEISVASKEGTLKTIETGVKQGAKQGVKVATEAGAGVATGVATGGVSVVAGASLKVANKFKESLQQKAATQSAHLNEMQKKANEQIEKGMEKKGFGGAVQVALGVLLAGVGSILSSIVSFTGILMGSLISLILVGVLVLIITITIGTAQLSSGTQNGMARVAKEELANADKNVGGSKYKDWYGMNADWCAIFVSWCANECGYIEEKIVPKSASVAGYRSWYQGKNLYKTKESEYHPKAGDLIVFENGMSHIGIVVGYDAESDRVETIEGNSGNSSSSPYHASSHVTHNYYPRSYSAISGYCTPEYPEEDSIEIPEPYGTVYTYMGWQTITSPSSNQYKLREEAGMNFDADGFAKIGERYVIACTTKFGKVGDYIDWELENGEVIRSVVGDIKNQSDSGANEYGHQEGRGVVEFVVDKYSWYGTSKHPKQFHPEWDSRVVRAIRSGSYW
ncbi:hypothetical protein M2454_000776 [Aequitasia blattaphilus]|uniref:CHAP domain-containing protein n=1 Tax=Aequitasia blattaphilus TaxID=2949332 RepID=A0ABT1E824_9FIRM|nr:CHAP domain-containing protein [Aequitasia blattaphilus]MCP1101983.1 CHAP domain-containing protein [Aequitasia blattaphilus]MCR8614623.1 CHAP domain-containing protein [Aequitasia blattaphilus]